MKKNNRSNFGRRPGDLPAKDKPIWDTSLTWEVKHVVIPKARSLNGNWTIEYNMDYTGLIDDEAVGEVVKVTPAEIEDKKAT